MCRGGRDEGVEGRRWWCVWRGEGVRRCMCRGGRDEGVEGRRGEEVYVEGREG